MAIDQSKLIKIISKQLGVDPEKITPKASFTDLGVDSLDAIEFFMNLEDTFDIKIPDDDFDTLKTVQDIITYLEKRVPNSLE